MLASDLNKSQEVMTVLGDHYSSTQLNGMKIFEGKSRDRHVMHGETIQLENASSKDVSRMGDVMHHHSTEQLL